MAAVTSGDVWICYPWEATYVLLPVCYNIQNRFFSASQSDPACIAGDVKLTKTRAGTLTNMTDWRKTIL